MLQHGIDSHGTVSRRPLGLRAPVRTTPSTPAGDSHALLGLELRQPRRGRWAVILPDLEGGLAACKVQVLTRRGFGRQVSGFVDPCEALRAARALGFTENAPGIVETLAASSRWRRRYGGLVRCSSINPALDRPTQSVKPTSLVPGWLAPTSD